VSWLIKPFHLSMWRACVGEKPLHSVWSRLCGMQPCKQYRRNQCDQWAKDVNQRRNASR